MYERKDSYYRKARAAGLRSRAAFKLDDLAPDLFRPGDRVVDLGAWPGGWLQVAASQVGPKGRVVGVDLADIQPLACDNVRLVRGDVRDEATVREVEAALDGPADVLLSDLAPKLTGIRDRDQARIEELARVALILARRWIRPGGRFVVKTFMTPAMPEFERQVRSAFAKTSVRRPRATRRGSSEIYVIASGKRAGAAG